MYKKSTAMYWPLLGKVGGGTKEALGTLHGAGCLLSSTLLITARHVWREIESQYEWPVIGKHDGLFRCTIEHEDALQDVLILRTTERIIESKGLNGPQTYPKVSTSLPALGESVGILTRLDLNDREEGPVRFTAFSEASVAICLKQGSGPTHLMLSCGLFQSGSSGGPVYSPNGTLIGIIVQSMQFALEVKNPSSLKVTAPIIAPVYLYARIIEQLKQTQK